MQTRKYPRSNADVGAKYLPPLATVRKRAAAIRWMNSTGFDPQFIQTMMRHDFEFVFGVATRMIEEGKSIPDVEVWFYELLDD